MSDLFCPYFKEIDLANYPFWLLRHREYRQYVLLKNLIYLPQISAISFLSNNKALRDYLTIREIPEKL